MRFHAPEVPGRARRCGALIAVAFGLLTTACSSADGDSSTATSDAPPATATVTDVDNGPVDSSSGQPVPTNIEGGDALGQLVALSQSEAFSGDNSDESIAAAVAAFDDAGFDVSPDGLAGGLPADCSGLDTQAVSEILGAGVRVETLDGVLAASTGYLSCALYSASSTETVMAYFHLAPDLNGFDNWGVVGTMEGAFDIPGLGDAASWSDGSRGDNLTNSTMLQLQVDQGGSQSLVQAQANEPQLAIIGAWTVPKLLLALAAVNASLT